jgi:hypothetical protein
LSLDQFKQKAEKESMQEMAMRAAGKSTKVVDPVYYQIDRGNKDL